MNVWRRAVAGCAALMLATTAVQGDEPPKLEPALAKEAGAAVDKTVQRLCDMGEAMVLAEKARRNRLAMSTGGGKKA